VAPFSKEDLTILRRNGVSPLHIGANRDPSLPGKGFGVERAVKRSYLQGFSLASNRVRPKDYGTCDLRLLSRQRQIEKMANLQVLFEALLRTRTADPLLTMAGAPSAWQRREVVAYMAADPLVRSDPSRLELTR
jgi:hypothetical protein